MPDAQTIRAIIEAATRAPSGQTPSPGRDLCKKALPSTAETQTQVFGCFRPKSLLILPKYPP